MNTLRGKAISPGLARGKAVVYTSRSAPIVPRYGVPEESIAAELARLVEAMAASRADLELVERETSERLGPTDSAIFSAHIALLDDEAFRKGIENQISSCSVNAEQAVEISTSEILDRFSQIEDEYLRERALDVRDVARRIIDRLSQFSGHSLRDLPPDSVIVARELLPSETVMLDRSRVRALVTEEGSKTSHAAILAKALGIPAVTGISEICSTVEPGALLLVDGCSGTVVMEPTIEEGLAFEKKADDYARSLAVATGAEDSECTTRDGALIELLANIGRSSEVSQVRDHHLLGVGLYRTEVLFLGSDEAPSFEAQVAAYRQVATDLRGLPLVVRTFDLGGDKLPSYFPSPSEHNPNIGQRGLRFALKEVEMFSDQLAAIVEVAADHPVRILFPMVVAGDDLERAVELLRKVAEQREVSRLPPIGAMIETPSAIFALPEIVRACDFISIGTNDLTQFMLAADRDAADLLDDFSILYPSVLRAIRMIVDQARAAQVSVSICGEAAGDPEIAPLLVGLGVRCLSMSPLRAARVRMVLRQCRYDDLRRCADEALAAGSAAAVRDICKRSF